MDGCKNNGKDWIRNFTRDGCVAQRDRHTYKKEFDFGRWHSKGSIKRATHTFCQIFFSDHNSMQFSKTVRQHRLFILCLHHGAKTKWRRMNVVIKSCLEKDSWKKKIGRPEMHKWIKSSFGMTRRIVERSELSTSLHYLGMTNLSCVLLVGKKKS